MKNKVFFFIISVFIIYAFLSGCMGRVKTPGILFSSDTYNFGIIEEGKAVNHTYEFTNSGTTTLVVKDVRPTCGCTVTGDYDKEVKPGQKGKIPISLDTSGFDGFTAKTIIVKTNVQKNPDYTLIIEGTVKVSATVNPKILAFGNIERKRTAPIEGKISILNRLAEPFKITDVEISFNNVETKIETIKDGFAYYLGISVKPPFKHGHIMVPISVKTDSKILPGITAYFSYYMEHMVKVFPNPLFVDRDEIKNGKEQYINVECEPGIDMSIADLSVNNNKVKASLKEMEKGRRYKLVLNLPRDFEFDPGNTLVVKFKTRNVPDEPVFDIPVFGM